MYAMINGEEQQEIRLFRACWIRETQIQTHKSLEDGPPGFIIVQHNSWRTEYVDTKCRKVQ